MTTQQPNDTGQPNGGPPLPPALVSALRAAPPRLDRATVDRLRQGIHERLVAAAEESSLGQALTAAMPVAHADAAGVEPTGALADALVDRLRSVPLRTPEWREVRAAVFAPAAEVLGPNAVGRRRVARNLLLLAAGIAATVALGLMVHGPEQQAPPQFVFADLRLLSDSGPLALADSPMAVLRRGGGR